MKKNHLKVAEALSKDVGRSLARIDLEDQKRLGIAIGDIIEISGKGKTCCRVMPAHKESRGLSCIQLDGLSRDNADIAIGEPVMIKKVICPSAESVSLAPINSEQLDRDLKYIGTLLDGLPVLENNRIRATLFGNRFIEFLVEKTVPDGPVMIHPNTKLMITGKRNEKEGYIVSYEDIGGVKPQLQRIREMIELPIRFPEVFEQLGIDAPKGVLMYGPPGCGKTLIARAIAQECDANFFSINGPEIIHKFYGESEAHLRKIFEEAAKSSPSIIFIDEIDAIAPKREKVVGDVEKRVVAQLLAMMDGLNRRNNVIVIAATNIPNALDPALRRPGRFDREIVIPIPDSKGRLEILEIHSRGMPLSKDVNLRHVASITHGFVGADLEALCRESAMVCLRRLLPNIDFSLHRIPYEQLVKLEVCMDDVLLALREVEPSAIREVFVELPDVHWQDVGGLDSIKEKLQAAVDWPLNHADLFKKAAIRPPKGILMAGPPGCGKTLLAKAVANESQVNFISVKGPSLMSKYIGESESAIRDVFHKARQAAPCIIFFDEIDGITPIRSSSGSDSHVSDRVLSQFLTEMDGIEDLIGVVVLAATNRLDCIDPALLRPGRFDEIVEIHLPNSQDRKAIFEVHFKDKPLSEEINLQLLVDQSEGFSGADIASVYMKAAFFAIRRAKNDHQDVVVERGDIDQAMHLIKARLLEEK
ncbi:MAG: CDC48 family AAA ATPase [Parachlamydiaceae bacterium]